MCCHYRLTREDWRKFHRFPGFYDDIEEDIREKTLAPALLQEEGRTILRPLSFGLDVVERKVLNARAETVAEKDFFRSSFQSRRAVFPCTLFFERDNLRVEHGFAGNGILYLAGIHKQGEFALLTRPADDVVLPFHERMPVLLPRERVRDYLRGALSVPALMELRVPAFLADEAVQSSLF